MKTRKNSIALVVNTYQKTLDHVFAPGFFDELVRQNERDFDDRILLINNVDDRGRAHELANQRIKEGQISAFLDVPDLLPRAFESTGLQASDLGRLPHYSDHVLVAPFATDAEYLLYWDEGVTLARAVNWVDRSAELLANRPDVFVVSPRQDGRDRSRPISETSEFRFNYGFSDQLFLARTDDLRHPIYKETCPVSLRYPISHVSPVVEQRLDSYMRNHSLCRAFFKDALYLHQGTRWYLPSSVPEATRFVIGRAATVVFTLQPIFRSPRWKI
jgi:hypothetical protein